MCHENPPERFVEKKQGDKSLSRAFVPPCSRLRGRMLSDQRISAGTLASFLNNIGRKFLPAFSTWNNYRGIYTSEMHIVD